MFGHPSFGALKRFADSEAVERERSRVAHHLERCPRCRQEVVALRELRAEARALSAPALPADLLGRVLSRRAAGDRVLLPVAEAPARRFVRRPAMIAAAAIMLVALAVFSPSGGLEAGITGGELTFDNPTPNAGAQLQVTYLPAAALAGERRLRLRGHLLTESSTRFEAPAVVVAELQRGRDGRFRGRFTLPDSVVYAVFAIEDMTGSRVDANGRAYWELLVHEAENQPLEAALWQRYRMSLGRDWTTGDQTIRRMFELYPQSPRALRYLHSKELERLGQAASDSLVEAFRPRFEALHGHYAAALGVSSDVAFDMIFFASTLKDRDRGTYWRERMMREHPRDAGTVQQKVFAVHRLRLPTAEALAAMEALWQEHGNASPQLLFDAWEWASSSGDTAALRRWGERMIADNQDWASSVGEMWITQPPLRDEGLGLLRRALVRVDSLHEHQRPLDHTVGEFRRARRGWKQRIFVAIAAAHLDAGNPAAALDTLERGAMLGWNPHVDRARARASLAAGDTALAVRALARVAADPSTPNAWADSVRAAHGSHATPTAWNSWVAAADSAMRSDILDRSRRQPIPAEMHVVRSDGSRQHLAFGEAQRVTVVTFISRWCPPSNEQLPLLAEAARSLEQRGAQLLVVTDEQPSESLRSELARRGYEGPVLHDVQSELSRGLRQFGTPQFFVIDREGMLRQDSRSLDAALQMASALQGVPMRNVPATPGPARAASAMP